MQQNQIAKQKIHEENYKRDLLKLTEEVGQLKKALSQAQKERVWRFNQLVPAEPYQRSDNILIIGRHIVDSYEPIEDPEWTDIITTAGDCEESWVEWIASEWFGVSFGWKSILPGKWGSALEVDLRISGT
jgi:hypothetical protein